MTSANPTASTSSSSVPARSVDDSAPPAFPQAQAVEAWLEGLRTLGARDPGDPGKVGGGEEERVLFVLDSDYGELTTVMYLVLGQACFRHARVLLSPRLYPTNNDALPGRVARWGSEQDVAGALEAFRPRLVVFASGYLMGVHGLLTAEALARLCEQARYNGAVVVTADPFLGLISPWVGEGLDKLVSIDIPANADAMLVAVKKAGDAILHNAVSDAEKVLRALPHLYPTYTDMDGVAMTGTDHRNVSFFNEALLVPPQIAVVPPDAGGEFAGAGDRPHWVFLISHADCTTQLIFEGPARFARIVADRLTEAAELGRHAVFLGPADLIKLVAPLLRPHERIHLLAFCSFRRAMSLLLTAEYCFYWNVVSHSILMQLWNGRPVILFDRGHLARAMPRIYDRVIAWYYQGWEPAYLDHQARLSLAVLAAAVAPHARQRADLMARFRRAPSPAAMVRSLRNGSTG